VPQFDPQQPCELHQYFADLDFAFRCAAIADHTKKKKHARHYVDVDMGTFGNPFTSLQIQLLLMMSL